MTGLGGLTRKQPVHEPLHRNNFAARMLSCFPLSFGYTLQPDKLADPLKILHRGYAGAAAHPQFKLTDADIIKERRGALMAAVVTNPSRTNITQTLPAPRKAVHAPNPRQTPPRQPVSPGTAAYRPQVL
ncbi:hypothetical protein E2C01_055366 [Portunus trituberculatus]|uniref:Uncharacterized protein n=1 Tax=Portunus trituberculatus TaxID=210409 RepID=A0A5B7GVQ9_PORTR|nr:hypothetical protein [Portunus trituberculatus]